ncbi:hypothetical protein LLEC1_07701 [Akanthomyces lecanii]|uniref:Uncharacterized protein n=1 Tax=Cordyceps confragosa TaxID=2714763 RepID=A0A179IF39_CORDF|nr:hypothetical protein LLEC1_07701 [Akanthomyces lecanii]
MTVSLKRSRLRRPSLAPSARIMIARVYMDSLEVSSEEECDVAATAGKPLEEDDGYERALRERRRRCFTRLCVEQLYRFEEA